MITIDTREHAGRPKNKMLGTHIHVPWRLSHLEYGDASWIGNGPGDFPALIGVERKRLSDFLQSMQTGRLANHQLVGMLNSYHYNYVIVEGIWRTGSSGLIEVPKGKGRWAPYRYGSSRSFTAATVDNFANALTCMLGVAVVFTSTLARTGQWMSNVYRWWTNKKWGQHKSCYGGKQCQPVVVGMQKKAPLVARVAMEFKGVGPDRARRLAEVFGSVEELCAATVEELVKVEGVGKTTAEVIYEEIRRET